MEQILVKIIVLCFTKVVVSQTFPDAPAVDADICKTMIPPYGTLPQDSTPPYRIKTKALSGGRVIITLAANISADAFKGFLMQVRNNEDKPFGEFTDPEPETKIISCPPGKNNAVTHEDEHTDKYQLKFTWQCPSTVNGTKYVGEAYVIATLIQEKKVYWTDIRSQTMHINS